jgi:hypothetical protein
MNAKINLKDQLICLKTGSKAKIITRFMHKNISYVKVSINMQFQKSYFQILKTLTSDEINK